MSELTRLPTTITATCAGVAALVAVATGSYGSPTGLALGSGGGLVVAIGLLRGRPTAVDVGCLLVFFGVVAGGLEGGSVELTVVGTVGSVVAWDLGQGALDLGAQLGRETPTATLEAVHVVSSLVIGLASATLGYGVYVVTADGQPAGALVLLVVAACLVIVSLGRRHSDGRHRDADRS